jgi:hypothetical protein
MDGYIIVHVYILINNSLTVLPFRYPSRPVARTDLTVMLPVHIIFIIFRGGYHIYIAQVSHPSESEKKVTKHTFTVLHQRYLVKTNEKPNQKRRAKFTYYIIRTNDCGPQHTGMSISRFRLIFYVVSTGNSWCAQRSHTETKWMVLYVSLVIDFKVIR